MHPLLPTVRPNWTLSTILKTLSTKEVLRQRSTLKGEGALSILRVIPMQVNHRIGAKVRPGLRRNRFLSPHIICTSCRKVCLQLGRRCTQVVPIQQPKLLLNAIPRSVITVTLRELGMLALYTRSCCLRLGKATDRRHRALLQPL